MTDFFCLAENKISKDKAKFSALPLKLKKNREEIKQFSILII